jgi:integrase/recombinase XerD
MLHLRKKNLADKTLKTYMGGMRTILYYFMEQGYIEHFKISMPKVDTPIKNVYTTGELERLLKKPDLKNCAFTEYRNWVLVNYLIGTGQRLNSVTHIKIKDLDLANGLVTLNATKNRKHTILPLTSYLVSILNQYLKYRQGKDDDFLFCTENGGQMTRGCISCAINRYNHSRGVGKTSIHMFRHSFAKNYLLNGGDVFRLQKLLCHSDLKVTKEYLDLSVEDIQQNYEAVNPLENLVKNNSRIKMNR